jgi:chromosome segregation ATPase
MDYEKLIERLRHDANAYRNGDTLGRAYADQEDVLDKAVDAITALLAENKRLKSLLSEGGQDLWSKENQRADRLEAENEKLRAELEQVKHQRDSYRLYHDDLASKPNCNTCADKDCKYRPIPGDTVRANCPLWRGPEEGEQDG